MTNDSHIAKNAEQMLAPDSFSPLCLAYLGDAVFELLVRSRLLLKGNRSVDKLNQEARHLVNAAAQASFYHLLKDKLTDSEFSVMKRGRNAKTPYHPKSASVADYRLATGVEALFGYLYLMGENGRISELFDSIGQDVVDTEGEKN